MRLIRTILERLECSFARQEAKFDRLLQSLSSQPSTAATAAPQATTGVHSRCWCQAVFNGIPIYGISLFQTSSIRPWRFSSPSSDSIISGSGQISGRCLPDGQRNARYDKTHAFGLGCIVFDLIFF